MRVYFKLGEPELTSQAMKIIDSLVYNDALTPVNELIIVGYADYLGTNTSNQELSEKRAKNVQAYLAELGIKNANVKLCVGKGEISRVEEQQGGYASDRRVDIVKGAKGFKVKDPVITKPPPAKTSIESVPSLTTVQVGQTMVLRNIYFHAGRHVVKDESRPELDKLYHAMIENPKLKIQIEGHVCCVPQFADALDEDTFEQKLSENRAKYIYDYLVQKGIAKDRLQFAGFGRRKPVVLVERSLADEDLNRRVEIRVLEN
jgi:outer membrane protein OmpA-like peptidoglycan-associated protein